MSNFELISFELCPFVQRSVITLKNKNVDFKIKYIDLKKKPDWFLKISPLGKVPVLDVDGTILFESAVINEFLDEVTEGDSLPQDPVQRAHSRAWIEFSSQMIKDFFMLSMLVNEDAFLGKKTSLLKKLDRLEAEIPGGNFFNGEYFTLVDAAIAPLFTRILFCQETFKIDFFPRTPKLKTWAETICAQKYVQESVKPDFNKKFSHSLKSTECFLAKLL